MLGAKYWHNSVGNDGGSFVRTVIILFFTSCSSLFSLDFVQSPIGNASGISALLLAAGSKGKRFSTPNTQIALVKITSDSNSFIDPAIQSQEVKRISDIICGLFAKHTGQTPAKIQADADIDFFMSAEDALEYGLIDSIIDRPESARQ